MKLVRVRIRNFRSFWSLDNKQSVDITLAPNANYFAGANNSGKSNLFRALELALRPDATFNPLQDSPNSKAWSNPTITLDFKFGQRVGSIRTLARYADEYERTVSNVKTETFASQGLLRYHVQFSTRGTRTRTILANGAGKRIGDQNALQRVLNQFESVVRFVDIRSGEDLESLLQRGFVEVLGSVLKERFSKELRRAEQARLDYTKSLTENLLHPLAEFVQDRIAHHVPDVREVHITPHVPDIEAAVRGARFEVLDAVKTTLEHKGTGVRGVVLLTLLSFLAETSRRAIVFAIEEPESFLHPGTHPELGRALEKITEFRDVSLLITTHSPFILSPDSTDGPSRVRVFAVRKSIEGRTTIRDDSGAESSAVTNARAMLLGSSTFERIVSEIDSVPADTDLVVVVEGRTDKEYIELASDSLCISLRGIHIIHAQGADDAAMLAIFQSKVRAKNKILVILDDDEAGRSARNLLTDSGKPYRFQKNTQVVLYSKWVAPGNVPVEAEDLFPANFLDSFSLRNTGYLAEKVRRTSDLGWHYGFTKTGKNDFPDWIRHNAKESHFASWRPVLEFMRDRAGFARKSDLLRMKVESSDGITLMGPKLADLLLRILDAAETTPLDRLLDKSRNSPSYIKEGPSCDSAAIDESELTNSISSTLKGTAPFTVSWNGEAVECVTFMDVVDVARRLCRSGHL